MLTIAVFASGNGSNLQAIIDSIERGDIDAKIVGVISDKRKAFALERARKHGIEDIWVNPKEFSSREDYDGMLSGVVRKIGAELIVLAGFMRVLSSNFVREFSGRILNIHPALLPKYPGIHSIEKAFQAKESVTGVTVHFVDEGVDTGPIIKQVEVPISPGDTLESLEKKVHEAEHKLYPEVIRLYSEGRISLDGRKVVISDV